VDLTQIKNEAKPRNEAEKRLFLLAKEPLGRVLSQFEQIAFPLTLLEHNDPYFQTAIKDVIEEYNQRMSEVISIM
jgi:hypothetical protein